MIKILIKNMIWTLLQVLLSFVILVITPVLFLLNSPVYMLRFVIGKSASRLKPNLGKMVTSRGAVFACDDIYGNPKCNIVLTIQMEGVLPLEEFRKLVLTKVINATNSAADGVKGQHQGEKRFPELCQFVTTWMGFFFFQDDPKFKIENHVIPYNGPLNIDLDDIREELANRAWTKRRPLWELLLTEVDNKTTIFFRFHHTLGDGFSILQIFETISFNDKKISLPNPSQISRPFIYKLVQPFLAFFDLAEVWLVAMRQRKSSPWHPHLRDDDKVIVSTGEHVDLSLVKEVKNHFKVSFTAVIFSIISGALREVMIQKKGGTPPTESLPTMVALPVSNHSKKLRNEMTGALAYLPINEKDAVTRLKLCEKDCKRMKRSTIPLLNQYIFRLIGLHFPLLMRRTIVNSLATTGISNFSGGFYHRRLLGLKVMNTTFCGGLQSGILGVGFGVVSYVDKISVATIVHPSLLKKEDVKVLTREVVRQLKILHHLANLSLCDL